MRTSDVSGRKDVSIAFMKSIDQGIVVTENKRYNRILTVSLFCCTVFKIECSKGDHPKMAKSLEISRLFLEEEYKNAF